MRRARSSTAKRCAVGLSVLVAIAGSTAVAEAHGPLSRTSDTTPNSVATTAPAEITPPSGAGTSEPTTTTAAGAGSDQPATISTVGVVVGIAGVTILLGGAAWWMVRREDEDEAPHPPRPSSSTDLT